MNITFMSLACQFLRSRGGFIAIAAILTMVLRLFLHPVTFIDLAICVGVIVAWPTLEWFFHRYLLHEWNFPMFKRTHTRHHDNPTSENGLPEPVVIIAYFIGIAVLCMLPRMLALYATVLCMLTMYEFVHFACHLNYKPKTWWGWAIRLNHLQHHRVNAHGQYEMLFPFVKRDTKVAPAKEPA